MSLRNVYRREQTLRRCTAYSNRLWLGAAGKGCVGYGLEVGRSVRTAGGAGAYCVATRTACYQKLVCFDAEGETNVDERLTKYAVKHAVYHLTDAGKQAENVARVLCSLRYVQQKLKLKPEISGGVARRYLLDDYEHSHYQQVSY